MDSTVFFSTFGLIFLAELGDKTQLAAMALATRYPWKNVFVGVAAAFLVLNLAAVLVGKALFLYLPLAWIQLASAALFFLFGISTLRAGGNGNAEQVGTSAGRPVLSSFLLILLAELGDKTQLATASLAAQYDSPLAVFSGSSLALWAVSLLGILVGKRLTRTITLSSIHKVAGILFLAFAAVALFQALG